MPRVAFAFVLLSACVPVSEEVERRPELVARVQASKFEPPTACALLGEVCGWGESYDESVRDLRGATAQLGGDWVTIDGRALPRGRDDNVETVGRAYRCLARASARVSDESCAAQ